MYCMGGLVGLQRCRWTHLYKQYVNRQLFFFFFVNLSSIHISSCSLKEGPDLFSLYFPVEFSPKVALYLKGANNFSLIVFFSSALELRGV